MAGLHQTVAALRIIGDLLDPDEISAILRCAPSSAFIKGQAVRGPSTGREYVKKSGLWMLDTDDRHPGDLDAQIEMLFSQLPNDLQVWRLLAGRFRLELSCGFFMKETERRSVYFRKVVAHPWGSINFPRRQYLLSFGRRGDTAVPSIGNKMSGGMRNRNVAKVTSLDLASVRGLVSPPPQDGIRGFGRPISQRATCRWHSPGSCRTGRSRRPGRGRTRRGRASVG